MTTQPPRAYVWSRALAYDQLKKIERVRSTRRRLSFAVTEATKFARCQIQDGPGTKRLSGVNGIWEGRKGRFDIHIRPLYVALAERLYELAAREAIERFPHLGDHHLEDGPEIGERRLIFTNRQSDLAQTFMINRMSAMARENVAPMGETISVVEKQNRTPAGEPEFSMTLVLDRPFIDATVWDEVKHHLAQGEALPIDPTPRENVHLAPVYPAVVTLSPSELAYMNWDQIRKPLTETDRAMFQATENFNAIALSAALARGADPNALDDSNETALLRLAHSDRWHYVKAATNDEWERKTESVEDASFAERIACIQVLLTSGAHMDLAGPDGITPLVGAICRKDYQLVDWLLRAGADDAIDCCGPDFMGDWPTAWDWAAGDFDCASEGTEEWDACKRTWHALRRHRQAPDGTLPHEKPDW